MRKLFIITTLSLFSCREPMYCPCVVTESTQTETKYNKMIIFDRGSYHFEFWSDSLYHVGDTIK